MHSSNRLLRLIGHALAYQNRYIISPHNYYYRRWCNPLGALDWPAGARCRYPWSHGDTEGRLPRQLSMVTPAILIRAIFPQRSIILTHLSMVKLIAIWIKKSNILSLLLVAMISSKKHLDVLHMLIHQATIHYKIQRWRSSIMVCDVIIEQWF